MTTLIKNILLVDGSGKPPFKADVLINNNKIAAIGSFPNYKADKVIFGNEGYLCPGFIDMNANSDRYLTLFSSPLHKDFLVQGVTSILIGHCGFSLAPTFYGSLNHFWSWTKTNHININWKSVKEFLTSLQKRMDIGVNLGTMVGHRVIREDILKNPNEDFRNLTANELRVFRSVLSQAIGEGAFGMSTGLGYFPYQQTTYHELRALFDIVKQSKGIATIHLRNEKENILDSVKEAVRLSQELSIPTVISHLRPFPGFEEKFEESLRLIESKTAQADIYFDTNPFSSSAVPIDSFIPDFLKDRDRNLILEKIQDENIKKKLLETFPKIDGRKAVILNAPGVEFLNGKTLYEFARNRNLATNQTLLKLMEVTRLRGVIFYENLDSSEIDRALFSPRSLISTNSPNFDDSLIAFKPERSYRTFTEFIKRASRSNILIEKAIAKISGLPSKIMDLDGRGFISDGYFADLVLLNKDFDISTVLINGEIAVNEGQILPSYKGKGEVLRNSKK